MIQDLVLSCCYFIGSLSTNFTMLEPSSSLIHRTPVQ